MDVRRNSQAPLERHMLPVVFAAVVLLPVADVSAKALGVDKPKNRDFDLALGYRVNERTEYRFVGLQARQLDDSKPMPRIRAVQPSGDKAAM